MSALFCWMVVLGQQPASEPFASQPYSLMMLVSAVVFALVCLLVMRRWATTPRQGIYCNPLHLWRELCLAHNLSHSQMRLLRRIAKQEKLIDACELFVEAAHLQRAASSSEFSRYNKQIEAIAAQLFGSSQ